MSAETNLLFFSRSERACSSSSVFFRLRVLACAWPMGLSLNAAATPAPSSPCTAGDAAVGVAVGRLRGRRVAQRSPVVLHVAKQEARGFGACRLFLETKPFASFGRGDGTECTSHANKK